MKYIFIGQAFGFVLLYLGCSFVAWDWCWFIGLSDWFPHERVMVVMAATFTQIIGALTSVGLSGD